MPVEDNFIARYTCLCLLNDLLVRALPKHCGVDSVFCVTVYCHGRKKPCGQCLLFMSLPPSSNTVARTVSARALCLEHSCADSVRCSVANRLCREQLQIHCPCGLSSVLKTDVRTVSVDRLLTSFVEKSCTDTVRSCSVC